MNEKVKSNVKQTLMEIIGSFLVAIGIYNFAVLAEFPMTGFSGIAIIFYRLWGLPIGIITILLNIPVALICYRLLGKGFLKRSLRCIVISSIVIDYIAPLLPVYQGSRFLAAICTGIIAGYGYALIYMQNSSTGGADFVIMSVKAVKPHISLGKIAFLSDIGIILAGGIIFRDIDGIIYGMIVNYLFAVVVDKVMYGVNSGKMTLIITKKGKLVVDTIDSTSGRGSTIIKGLGGYQQEGKDVILCACNNKEMYQVQQAVKAVDPESFIIILESNEVHGEGFHPLVLGKKEEE